MDDIAVLTESFVEKFEFWSGIVNRINTTMISDSMASGLSVDLVKKFTYNEFCQEYLEGASVFLRKYGELTQNNANSVLSRMIARRLGVTFRNYQYDGQINQATKMIIDPDYSDVD